LLLVDL